MAERWTPLPYHVAVVGGGISGLAAAWFLRRDGGERVRVTVFEAAGRIGGKLAVSPVAGVAVDEGADALLTRRPEGVQLVEDVGVGERLAYPATTSAALWTAGAMRPLPPGLVMGVPSNLRAVARSGVLSRKGLVRAALDLVRPRDGPRTDVSVGRYVRTRLGDEVVDRLVEPLLGGVYAGRADALSLDASMPGLAAAVRSRRSLLAAAHAVHSENARYVGPVFTTLTGGLGTLPAAVAAACGARVRTSATVRELRRTRAGWRLTVGPASGGEVMDVDAVIVAAPATAASRLLAPDIPAAAAELAAIEYASVALVTLAYRSAGDDLRFATGSGFLIPPAEGTAVKAVTYLSAKWPHIGGESDLAIVRCSLGRVGEERVLQHDDADLVALTRADLAKTVGIRGMPVDSRVTRWGGGLPQYAVGHTDRVRRIMAAVADAPGLAVCGAAYQGIGVPACVRSARDAADRVLDQLSVRAEWRHGKEPGHAGQAQGTGPQPGDPIHDVVGVQGAEPDRERS